MFKAKWKEMTTILRKMWMRRVKRKKCRTKRAWVLNRGLKSRMNWIDRSYRSR